MKINIPYQPYPKEMSWGGGNASYYRLIEKLKEDNVVSIIGSDTNPDVVYSHDMTGLSTTLSFIRDQNQRIVIRINDLGTHSKKHNQELIYRSNKYKNAIYIVPSIWAKEYIISKGLLTGKDIRVIENAADDSLFPIRKLKIVTHHWSNNPLKGEDIYSKLEEENDKLNIIFTYIGRPCFIPSKTTTVIEPPKSKQELYHLLIQNDWYITASRLEAGANHILEAMNCRLPILYHTEGGSIPEYVGKKGIPYSSFDELRSILAPKSSMDDMLSKYIDIINEQHNRNNKM